MHFYEGLHELADAPTKKVPETIDIYYHCNASYTRITNEEDCLSKQDQKNEKSIIPIYRPVRSRCARGFTTDDDKMILYRCSLDFIRVMNDHREILPSDRSFYSCIRMDQVSLVINCMNGI